MKPIKYRICWNASSNISFHGETEWFEWEGDEGDSEEDIKDSLNRDGGGLPEGLSMALEACGFEWWVETQGADA